LKKEQRCENAQSIRFRQRKGDKVKVKEKGQSHKKHNISHRSDQ